MTFDSLFGHSGYPVLFLLSFLAATILPIGSEWMLVLMIVDGFSPGYCVLVATVGNYLGACTTYLIGCWGADYVPHRLLRMNEVQVERAKGFYRKYGAWSLLFSWVPVVGDPLCLVAGLFRVPFVWFSVLVFSGKCARYALLGWVVY